MRNRLQCVLRTLAVGWLWLAVLLVLPACDRVFGLTEIQPGTPNLNQGTPPRTLPIFCDIESMPQARHCASDDEVANLLSEAHSAVNLVNGQAGGNAALDYSADARNTSGCGAMPVVVPFDTSFPQGSPVCVKYLDIIGPGLAYSDPNGVCVAQCEDLNGGSQGNTSAAVATFCAEHAHVSTNYPLGDPTLFGFGGFQGACTAEGVLQSGFDDPTQPALIDPRRVPEPVGWLNLTGVQASGAASNTLTRTTINTNGNFDAGAASSQTIASGDGYVQFTATETNLARLGGLSIGPGGIDATPGFQNINFAIDLFSDGQFYVFESGQIRSGPSGTAFGTYTAGDRFRVTVTDNFDGSATIRYSRLVGPCAPGTSCAEDVFYASTVFGSYPMHADSSFKEQGATLDDVRLVRIH